MGESWQLFGHFLVRHAGFPVGYISRFSLREELSWFEQWFETQINMPDKVPAALRTKLESCVGELYRRLQCIARHPLFREGILWSSWDAYQCVRRFAEADTDHTAWNHKFRTDARTIMAYLQRFCTKNDTNGALGPVAHGQIVRGRSELSVPANLGVVARNVRLSHWAAQKLAARLRQPRLRRSPLLFLDDGTTLLLDSNGVVPPTRVRLSQRERLLLERCENETVYEQDLTQEDAAVAKAMRAKGCLISEDVVPSGTSECIRELRRLVADAEAPSQVMDDKLTSLQESIKRFENRSCPDPARLLDLQRAAATVCACNTSRRSGVQLGDRFPLSEDCESNLSGIVYPEEILERVIASFATLLDTADLRVRERKSLYRDWFRQEFHDQRHVPLPLVIERLFESPVMDLCGGEEQPYRQALCESARSIEDYVWGAIRRAARSQQPSVQLDERVIREFLQSAPERICDSSPAFCSVDVFLASCARDTREWGDRFSFIVGETHPRMLLNFFMVNVLRDSPQILSDMRCLLKNLVPDAALVVPVYRHEHKLYEISRGFFDAFIEIGSRSSVPGQCRIAISDLWVTASNTGVLQVELPDGRPVVFDWPLGSEELDYFCRFTKLAVGKQFFRPVRGYRPRVELGSLAVARRAWKVSKEEVGPLLKARGPANLLLHATALRQRWKIDRQVFMKVDGQKPLFVDFANPCLIECAQRGIRRTRGPNVLFEEVLPRFSDLWLSDNKGGYTSEFRLICYRA